MKAQRQVIETEEGRFAVVFKHLEELKGEAASTDIEESDAARAEADAIDELRRLSAEFAETPTIHYTST